MNYILRNYPNNNIRKLLCPYEHYKLKKINYTYYNRLRNFITSNDFKCIFYLSIQNNEIIEYEVVTNHQAQVLNLFDNIKKDLKLNDRNYKCYNCGIEIDRDYNASINLEKANIYKIIA